MGLAEFSIQNYRSIKHAWLKLDRVNVIVGPNGSGKSNLYRAIYLLASTASGRLARNVAEEGGMSSVLWSGKGADRKTVELSVKLDNLQYDLSFAALSPSLGGVTILFLKMILKFSKKRSPSRMDNQELAS